MKKVILSLLLSFAITTTLGITAVYAQKVGIGAANNRVDAIAGQVGFSQESGDIGSFTGTIINAILSLVGTAFLGLTVYGGFLWMTDRGNADQVERAKKMIIAAVIGLFIVLSAFAITQFVTARFNT